MNQYEVEFIAACPNNGQRIKYQLCIKYVHGWIPVEAIASLVADIQSGYHEDIAETLREAFGGMQTLTADRHGVRITTHRTGEARKFTVRQQ